jgi:hypothetical protein
MAEAFVERGIGETRAIVADRGAMVEVHVERDDGGWRAGDVREVRLATILVPAVRGIVVAGGVEALLTPLPATLTEGIALRVAVVREALAEAGRARLAKVVATTDDVRDGPTLVERLQQRGMTVSEVAPTGRFEELGWTETVEEALSGRVAFAGGSLTISPTPAMTVIDVDGDLPPVSLALTAAEAVAAAITRFDLTGSIGIDFPTVGDRAARTAIGVRLDAALPPPFERTAVNGFGFVQIVRPRRRASFIETLRADRAATAALALLRTAEGVGFGGGDLVGPPPPIQWLMARPGLVSELERRRGGRIDLRIDAALPISGGYVAAPR